MFFSQNGQILLVPKTVKINWYKNEKLYNIHFTFIDILWYMVLDIIIFNEGAHLLLKSIFQKALNLF